MTDLIISLHCVSPDSLRRVRQALLVSGCFVEVFPGFWMGSCTCQIEHLANRLFSLVGWQDVLLVQSKTVEGQVMFFPK
ncbi:MAG: hypothetical protein ACTJGG_01295 [Marinomonas foliarum]